MSFRLVHSTTNGIQVRPVSEKNFQFNPAVTFWLWNILFASFFTFVRAFLKQEFKSPWVVIATSIISLGTALFAGYIAENWGAAEWTIRLTIAGGALLSYDLMRGLMNMSSRIDGSTFWALFKVYTGQSSLPDLPKDDKDK